ncbi:AAEL001328-PA [Aedes aegypti]|uniref:Uncharacterized protein n=2 Tax=Aedes aegypti TaxID=7159 RepID=Q17LH4_AEDAE|nr:uncharacterized protein LOC5570086 [Aedes aegypti]XP_021696588.1 uncharacterized protein LOC5570086 [Aedes aegypti]EAT47562.1 AAEL001328-PA [Aedes aegypti]
MERIFSGYIKAHGYAIAVCSLMFGCIFALNVVHVGNFPQTGRIFGNDDQGEDGASSSSSDIDVDRISTGQTYFRMHPMGQLVFSLAWVLTGTIFLVGLLFEKKKTILPFASVFTIDWSVILIRHLTALEQRSFQEVVLSSGTAVLVVIPVYVGFTLAALHRLFEQRSRERAQLAEENGDLENGRKPVKFILGDEFDDSWIS